MFTTEHFRRPGLHETISHLCLEKIRHARFLPYEFMPVESVQVKCQFLVKTSQHLNFFFLVGYVSENQNIYACADAMFEQERKTQYLQTWRWSVVPNESSRDFGPCDRFWTQLALRCFLLPTLPPGTALRERYVGP